MRDWLEVHPEFGDWGTKCPLSAEQWFLQIKDRIPKEMNEHARICFVAGNYEDYCRKFQRPEPADLRERALKLLEPFCTGMDDHDDENCGKCSEMADSITVFASDVQREALLKYGRHLPDCQKRESECSQPECGETHSTACTCGLDAAIRSQKG